MILVVGKEQVKRRTSSPERPVEKRQGGLE